MLSLAIHWNVDPVFLHIGSFELRWYSLGFVFAFAAAYLLLQRMYKYEKVNVGYLDHLTVYFFFATLIGARLGHCFFYDAGYFLTKEHWFEIIWPFHNGQFTGFQGLASHGAAIAILLTMWLYWYRFRINIWWILDRLVIAVAIGGFFIRLGNLFNSEIYGHATNLPWGFIFERNGETLPKHPTQLYESLSYLAISFGFQLYYQHKKGRFKGGTIFGWWLVILFGVRFLIEFVKNDQVDFEAGMALNMGQLLSLPFIVGGLVIAWLAHKGWLCGEPFPHGETYKFENKDKKK